VSSKISFCDYDNKSGLPKASGISTRDSNSQISHAFLALHDGLPHNSALPVTLPGLMQSHFWKGGSHNFCLQLSWHSKLNSFVLLDIPYILSVNRKEIKDNLI
jgi:hypothetical protein